MKKMTKKEMFTALLNVQGVKGNSQFENFINHELELLAKKSSASGERKPTANQKANEGFKVAIVEGMESNRLYTVTEIIKSVPAVAELSNQRVSALLRQLIESGKVKRVEEKRKAYFQKLEG